MQQRNAARQCQSMKNIVSSAHLSTTKRTCQSETHCMQRQGKRRRLCSSHSSPVLVAEKKFGFPSAPARCHRLQRRTDSTATDSIAGDRSDAWTLGPSSTFLKPAAPPPPPPVSGIVRSAGVCCRGKSVLRAASCIEVRGQDAARVLASSQLSNLGFRL